jgi:membrane protease YdiL (CAAX protease family)
MPSWLDLIFVVLVFGVLLLVDGFVLVPRFRARVAAGLPSARVDGYRRAALGQSAITLVMLVGWIVSGRSWVALGLAPAGGNRLFIAIALIGAILALFVTQVRGIRRIAASAEKREVHRKRFAELAFMLPGDATEYRWFIVLSTVAGICEELMCRGYLVWVLKAYVGLPAAVVLSAAIFGVGHMYQGWRGVVKTGVVGLVMNAIVLAGGWLVPAMLVHALIDATSGLLAYTVLRDGQREVLKAPA